MSIMTAPNKRILRDASRVLWWSLVLRPFEAAAMRTSRRAQKSGGRVPILVLRLDALGDFVIWLDAARGLRSLYPSDQFEITLLGNQSWCGLAEESAYFDRVWGMDRKKFATDPRYRFRLLRKVRQGGFEVILNPAFSRDFLWSDAVARAGGSAKRIASQSNDAIMTPPLLRLTDSWYTQIVPARDQPLMELERNADFVRGLGAPDFQAGLSVLPAATKKPSGFAPGDYYVLFPGAGRAFRQWPVTRFADIARRLHRQYGWTGIVAGGQADRPLGQMLETAAGAPIQNWAGQTRLAELNGVIAGAKVLLSNETSAVHIAAALGTPAVSVTGGGHFGRYIPYHIERSVSTPLPIVASHPMPCFGCNWECIYETPPESPKPCIESISVDTVWASVQAALSAASIDRESEE